MSSKGEKYNKKIIGKLGEEIAFRYLFKKGYKLIAHNYAEKYGEIDLVMRDADETLVFVEVKAFSGNPNSLNGLIPEDNFTPAKRHKLDRICKIFIDRHPSLINEERGWRVDLIAACLRLEDNIASVRHYKNV